MPLAQKLTKKKAKKKLPIQGPDINRKGHNTAVAGGSGKAGTLITPKIDVTKITKDKEFQEQLYSLIDDIEITEDDVPDEMLEDWYDLQDELKPVLIEKNWLLWATLFSAVVLPGIVQGTRSEPTVKQPAVIIKGKQQEPIPPLEPRQIVNYSQEYFKEHGLELCKSLTETDLTRLKGDLVQNWNKGEDAFAKAFKESYPVSKQRLELIYRSERHMAEYHGVMKRAERAGHTRKMWRAVGDERTCSECMDYDLEIVPIDEPFSNGMMTANAHPGCRCSMVTLTDEEYDEMPDEQFSDEQLPDYGEEWDEEMKQDAAHLNDAFEFIKLNYRCEENPPGSGNFKCDVTQQSDKSLDKINKTRLKELKVALKDTKTRNQNIRDQMDKVRRDSPEWKNLQKQIDIDSEYKLEDSIKILQYKHPDVPKEFESFLSDSDTIIKNLTPEENQELNLYVTGFGNAHYQSMLAKLDGKLPENVDEYVKELVGKKWNYDTGKFDPNDSIMQKEYKNTMEYVVGIINKIKIIDSIMDKSRTPNDIIIRTGISSALFDINELSPGDEFEVPTYLSTSRSDKVANGFALRKYTMDMKNYKERPHANKIPTIPTILEIRLSKGSKAIALENFVLQSQGANAEYVIGDKGVAGTGSQQEILLARGTKFKIKEISETEFRGKKIRKVIVDGSN